MPTSIDFSLKRFLLALTLVACLSASFANYLFAEYSVVILSSGKIVKGELVTESADTIVLLVDNVKLQFKKNTLDLEKMKTLNQAQTAQPKSETPKLQEKTIFYGAPVATSKEKTPTLAETAQKANQERKGNAKLLTEGDQPCSSASEFSTGPTEVQLSDVKFWEKQIAELELRYKRAGKTLDPNDHRLLFMQNALAWTKAEVEEGESAVDRHKAQMDAADIQEEIRSDKKWLKEAQQRGDTDLAQELEDEIEYLKKELEFADERIQNMHKDKRPCAGLQADKPQEMKIDSNVKPSINTTQTKKSNARVFTEADIHKSEEETPEELRDLTPERRMELIEETKKEIEWSERQIQIINENGGSEVLVKEHEEEIEKNQKKLRFLTNE